MGGKKTPTCEKCNAVFTCRQHLSRHRKICCAQQQEFTCSKCGKNFNRSDNLKRHIPKCKGVRSENPRECAGCGRIFSKPSNLQRHQCKSNKIKIGLGTKKERKRQKKDGKENQDPNRREDRSFATEDSSSDQLDFERTSVAALCAFSPVPKYQFKVRFL